MKRPASLLLLLLVSLLSACGFHLRGAAYYDAFPFDSIYVVAQDSSLFGTELTRNLRASTKTKLVNDIKDAQVVLEVISETKSKSFLSLNVQGRAREYSLNYEVAFRLRDLKNNVQLMPPTKITASRTLVYNELVALGRESEEEMLYREMQSDLVMQVLRRMGALKKKPVQNPGPPPAPSAGKPHAVAP